MDGNRDLSIYYDIVHRWKLGMEADSVCDRKSGSGRSGQFLQIRFRPNSDRIDRIWLSPGFFINLGVGFDVM